nr:hypothetical protein [Desulfobulbaceae bacterium]
MTFFKKRAVLLVPALLVIALASPCQAAVETETVSTYKGKGGALDTAVSGDGKFFYVLAPNGTIEIFPTDGGPKEEVKFDGKADKVAVSESGDILFLTDSASGTTRLMSVEYVQSFDLAGAPYKGPENAPVSLVIFSDFQ